MKQTLLIFIFSLATLFLATAQNGISFQGILRDSEGQLVAAQEVSLRMAIAQGTPEGSVVFEEVHLVNTNPDGSFNLLVGSGEPVSGDLMDVNWQSGAYFLRATVERVGTDPWSLQMDMSLLAVPYTFFAGTADSLANWRFSANDAPGLSLFFWSGEAWQPLSAGAPGTRLAVDSLGMPVWVLQRVPSVGRSVRVSSTSNSVLIGYNLIDDGGLPLIRQGLVWSTGANPVLERDRVRVNTTDTPELLLDKLTGGQPYYVRAFAENVLGVGYGPVLQVEVEGCESQATLTLTSSSGAQINDKEAALVRVPELNNFEYVTYYINDQPFISDGLVAAIPNPGTDFSVYARGVDTLGCVAESNVLNFEIVQTEGIALCIPDFDTPLEVEELEVFSFAEEKTLDSLTNFTIKYDLSGGFDIVNLYSGSFLAGGDFLGATFVGYPQDTLYFSETETAYYLVFTNINPGSETRQKNIRAYLASNALFLNLRNLIRSDLGTLGYVDEFSADKFTLIDQIKADLALSFNDTSNETDAPNPLLTAMGDNIRFSPEGNTLFYAAQVQDTTGLILSDPIIFGGEPVADLPYMFRFFSRLFNDSRFLDALIFRSGSDSKLDSMDILDRDNLSDHLVVALDNGRAIAGEKYVDLTSLVETYHTSLHFYHLFSLFPTFKAVDGLLLTLEGGDPEDMVCLEGLRDVMTASQENFIRIFLDDAAGGAEALSLFSFVCYSMAEALLVESCAGQKSMYKLLNGLGATANRALATYNGLKFKDDVANATRSARHHFYVGEEGVYGKQVTTVEPMSELLGAPNGFMFPDPVLRMEEYAFYAEEQDATQTYLRIGERIPSGLFASGNRSVEVEVSFEPFVEAVYLGEEVATSSPHTFVVNSWENTFRWKIKNEVSGFTPGTRVKLGRIKTGALEQDIFGTIELPQIRYLANASTEELIVVEVHINGQPLTEKYRITFEVFAGGGTLTDPENTGSGMERLVLETDELGRAVVRWNQTGNMDRLRVSLRDDSGGVFDSVIVSGGTDMVLVEGGSFDRGCTAEQGSSCAPDESPVEEISLASFFIGRFEVTHAQWADLMGTDAGICPECPVTDISLEQAMVFIDSLNARTGFTYRLPTEAEWEYAARGGQLSQGYVYAGGNTPADVAWYQDNAPAGLREVGQKLPNELGIYDMSGNVAEWCSDWYAADAYSGGAKENPGGPANGSARVIRGGSWQSIAGDLRVSRRASLAPTAGNGRTGLRLARTVNLPEVVTVAITGLTDSSVLVGGNVVSNGGAELLERGFVWSVFDNPTTADLKVVNGNTIGLYSSTIKGLSPGRTYYVRAYATSRAGTAYGESLSFTTPATLPGVETSLVSGLTDSTAISGGNVTTDGGAAVVARGVVWATAPAPTLADNFTTDGSGTGVFNSTISGLAPVTTYYIRAYATNAVGTAYGETVSITTPVGLPVVSTLGISELTDSSALSGGQVVSDGGAEVTARGVVWDTLPMPVLGGRFTVDGSGEGVFASNIAGLRPGRTYYLRAYATNELGTAYGEEITFAAPAILPVVVTDTITAITDSSAVGGGRVLSDGGALVTARGVVWSTTVNPTLAVRNTANGTGEGAYVSELRDLQPGTTYYIRAYATNTVGTAYGQELSFVTPAVLPTVITDTITAITDSSATGTGVVVLDGGATVTDRGMVWASSPNPIVGVDSSGSSGVGTGLFSVMLKDLRPGTNYYARAYATNSAGTAYGAQQNFVTPAVLPEVTTGAISNITDNSAVSRGEVVNDGGGAITARGIVWGTSPAPTLSDNATLAGTGVGLYASSLSGLQPGTTYYVRAYATNSAGTAYGADTSFVTPAILPMVTTDTLSAITANSAIGGGSVVADGGATVTARGVVWSTVSGATIDSTKTTDGTGTGAFVSNLSGLLPGTTYFVRAYATNAVGTAYGAERSFMALAVLPVVETQAVAGITDSSAMSGGNVTYDGGAMVSARGLVWDTLPNPTLANFTLPEGSGTGTFTANLEDLDPVKTYYVRAYATNAVGTAYGATVTFSTPAGLPRVNTTNISALTDSSAVTGGTVISDRGTPVTARGVVWSQNLTPTLDSLSTLDSMGLGTFVSRLTGLIPGTTYHTRAYATNATGTAYGPVVSFVTPAVLPVVVTDSVTAITDSSGVSGGNVTYDGGAAITARGIVWGTGPQPTLDSMKTQDNIGVGAFQSTLRGLSPVTIYYVRAYATNSVGTTYGNEVRFTTPPALPVLTTTAITSITDTRATTGGTVVFDGGAAVTVRGVVWDTLPQPTIAGMKTTNGAGEGSFTSTVAGLSPVRTYYVRAYATSAAGTGYGPELVFVTPASVPLVATAALSNLMATTATGGGNVLDDGGAPVTARGVVWDTLSQPTLADQVAIAGDSLGMFSAPITGLIPGTIYYLRAYATNSAGTAYGEEISFVTPPVVPTVTTQTISGITDSSANSGGTITYNGGAAITARGVVWGTTPTPTIDSMKTSDGAGGGSFSSTISGLTPITTYYVRAYATNSAGTAYGNALSFTTLATTPTVTTAAFSALTDSSAVSGGTVVDDGGAAVTARGLVWGRGSLPTLDSMKTVNGSGNGAFTGNITGLDPETRYYVRAYATNERGTSYGNEITFLTPAGLPRISTLSLSSLTDSSAVSGGNVLSDRGATVTARGIVWGVGPNPTLDSTVTVDGTGTGLFSSQISGLSPGTKYYVRAYATNAVGTRYGNEISFTTPVSMVLVQGGTFTMGCTPEQGGDCDSDESDPHDVTLSTYFLARYEVTQSEWEAVMGTNPSNFTGCSDCPVENVSWNEVQEFITRLNIETGFNYRLPTEAEWEFAARGGLLSNGYKYSGGDGVDSIAWYYSNSSAQTQPVGQKTPNELDLYDMSGNVWEWVSDRYEGVYDSTDVTNPTGPVIGNTRVVRGGSWFALEADLRVSERSNFNPTTQLNNLGFRLARPVSPPIVETYSVGSITDSTAVGGGNVLSDGGSLVTARGMVWSTTSMPTLLDSYSEDGTGMGLFTSTLDSLLPGTTYFVRAYATNGAGTSYGGEISFTTPPVLPVVTTSTINVISDSRAAVGGNVTYNGGATVTARGVVWSTATGPTLADSKVMSGSGTGMFSDTVQVLSPVTTYYARAFATNSVGTAYGAEITFTTPAGLPVVTTAAITGLTDSSAVSGGTVLTDKGDSVTVRGIVWSLTSMPTTADMVVTSGSDTGTYVSNLSGLSPATTYYVRAYATNGMGTAYGEEVSFNTNAALPTLGTTPIGMITDSSSVSGGTILDDGGSAVTARGVVWSTTSGPTLANSKTTDGSGIGVFTSTLTELLPATTYYVRAYATNAVGTAYGQETSFTTNARLPVVISLELTALTDSSATAGGRVASNGGSAVVQRGVVWNTTVMPTIADNKSSDGTGTGEFASILDSLDPGTLYYYRAYATNGIGTAYGDQMSFTTLAALPELTTTAVASFTDSTAISGGNVVSDGAAAVTARGIVWSTSPNPTLADSKTTNGSGTGAFASTLTGLDPATLYYIRAYATNSVGTAYGTQVSFTTAARLATVSTISAASVTDTSAVSGGNVISNGGAAVTARGIVWSTTSGPTLSDNVTTDGSGTGVFASSLSGLSPLTTYYIRAYATNSIGTAYGEEVSFETLPGTPDLTTTVLTSITDSSAVSGGNITSNNGAAVTARGVVWNTTGNPTLSDSKTTNGTGSGAFASTLNNLDPGTTYYVRAYATNSAGTGYGDVRSFTTDSIIATVLTTPLASLTDSSVVSGGTITLDGGSTITARGVVWSTSPNPTILDNKTTDGTGLGTFTSQVTGLNFETRYYLRAYATNGVGTAYGDEIEFVTPAGLPVVQTDVLSEITQTTAAGGGTVVSDKGSPVTARGVVWSTAPNPTIANSKTTDGSGTGAFESDLSGLSAGTKYYVRAYATNDAGTAYGETRTFTTPVDMVLVQGGTFNMGCTTAPCETDAQPQHAVTVSAFYLGTYEVTQSLWAAVMGSNPASFNTCATCPVENVSWNDVQLFVDSLNALTNLNYRLPTEAEWEFAARGGNDSQGYLYAGGNTPGTVAWYSANASGRTHEVGQKTANELGLFDMSGNVSEWVSDWYNSGYYSVSPATDPTGPAMGTLKVARGGAWSEAADSLRVTNRQPLNPGTDYNRVGLRLARTVSLPTLTTAAIASFTDSSAVGGGTIVNDGGAPVIARGVVWGINPNPTLADAKTTNGGGEGTFVSNLSGLLPGTTYYVRAYATNGVGTAYGTQTSFTTLTTRPRVTTTVISALTDTSAVSGGVVASNGGAAVTARGVVWGTATLPTLDSTKTINGTGLGTFTSTLDSLSPVTTYYVRAYATNAVGTSYGNELSFTTPPGLAVVETDTIRSVTDSSALVDATVVLERGAAVTARGVVWGTSPAPTLVNGVVAVGAGLGSYTATLSALSPGTKYYVRAYATNSAGTQYGNEWSFTTPIAMVYVQGGVFAMGCTTEQVGDCQADESPVDTVTLSNFYIGKYEITKAQWIEVMGSNPSTFAGCLNCPVENISWSDAQEFIDSLNAQTGYDYRLPTEAEWEFAARGGNLSDGYKYAGSDMVDSVAWYFANSLGKTQPVGQKQANELGIYDMSGNVGEWVEDWYDAAYYGTSMGINPGGPGMGSQKVVRGGSWFQPEDSMRVADRNAYVPGFRNNRIGLRLVRSVNLATVLTDSISMITDSSAVSGGNVISDAGSAVTERGVVWATSTEPTVNDDKTVDMGTGTGTYTSVLDSLDPGVTYYVRAYAINGNGTSYGREFSFATPAILPTVQTDTVTMVTDSSATGGGGVVLSDGGAAITARGLVWSIGTTPTLDSLKSVDGTGTGAFSSVIDSLIPLTTYYYRAYATNSVGTAYGSEYSFTTPAGAPEVLTDSVSMVTDSSLVVHVNVYFDGGDSVLVRGVAWGTSPNPTIAGDTIVNGSDEGTFSVAIDSLSPGVVYYIRGYAINSIGIGYGNQLVVATDTILPVVTTDSLTALSGTEATGGGVVVFDGGATVTARGLVWDTLTAPTLADDFSVNGTGTGAFVSVLDSLQPFTTYYMRAYATNPVGTSYGNEISFTTPALLPTVVTDTVTAITDSTAMSGGTVVSDGGVAVTAYGLVWGRATAPTIDSFSTVEGSGTASFTSQLDNLLPVTTYYVRAYATNSAGTGYGNEFSFTTPAGTPRVSTTSASGITDTTAITGGTVIAEGGSPVTARGVVWGSRPYPTLDSMVVTDGSTGVGTFVSNLTGLERGRRYYVRAYATNAAGTAYGDQISFTTSEFVTMVLVEAGTFTMGCTGEQTGCDVDESPTHSVTLDSFYIGKYEVTQAEWEDIMGSNPSGNTGCADCPVERVSWDDVQEFIDSLNAFTGLTYRLPTEAEWEFAARGGNSSQGYQYAGNNTVDSVAWYNLNSISTTHPVGQKLSNELDLYDMSGNVHEWVNDRYGSGYYSVSPATNPTGPATGTDRVARGGSFGSTVGFQRVASRERYLQADYQSNLGFRLARSISLPMVATDSVSSVGQSTAVVHVNVVSDGGFPVTERGVVWDIASNPTVDDFSQDTGEGTGTFTINLSGLQSGRIYYARGYAINNDGVAYGPELSFTTVVGAPTVVTAAITGITDTSATGGGNVIWDGGSPVTDRGVVWSSSPNPVLPSDSSTVDGGGTGLFTSTIDSLTYLSTYYVRAYATNAHGTSYGSQVIFNTAELINLVLVPGGTFTMGCTAEQGLSCADDEGPAHAVTLDSFYIGAFEVTQSQWAQVMGTNPSLKTGCPNCPVERVSWNDVQVFIDSLNAQTGRTYRLPTEAEWEYAARGGDQSQGYKYAGGNTPGDVAWYNPNSGGTTQPVGQKLPNELNIYDMSGNVWEWCSDWYSGSYYISSPAVNPTGPPSSVLGKVLRGGGWDVNEGNIRVSERNSDQVANGFANYGFRLARDIN